MDQKSFDQWARSVVSKSNFALGKVLYRAAMTEPGQFRNSIYVGAFKGKPAVLKLYDEWRVTDEPAVLQSFHEHNRSRWLAAPRLYASEMITAKKGWLIMERLPEQSREFTSPIKPEERVEFLKIYLEYRRNFPTTPTRPLTLSEGLRPDEFHLFRLGRWFQAANDFEADATVRGEAPVLDPSQFHPRYQRALDLIRREFRTRKMVWCHGHFKPKELFRTPGSETVYLTDFAHTKLYPEGYEFAFIVWADHIMKADWQRPYASWREGIFSWIEAFGPIADELKIKNFPHLIRASLIERIFGAVLADVTASRKPREEKEKRLALLFQSFDDLVK